jgi:hypothetical protein
VPTEQRVEEGSSMEAWGWIVIIVVALAVVGAVWWIGTRRRSTRLRERFGPEYERAMARADTPAEAEAELEAREVRRGQLDIRQLEPDERERFLLEWKEVQANFVDDPEGSARAADRLVNEVMLARGYPMEDFDRRAADISVDHPTIVENYRSAHSVYRSTEEGKAETEDLRRAFVHYRALFEELLEIREERAAGEPNRDAMEERLVRGDDESGPRRG